MVEQTPAVAGRLAVAGDFCRGDEVVDHRLVKLGKLPYVHDPRNLLLTDYLVAPPAAPDSYNWFTKVSKFGPMYNLTVGDCTCAGAAHMIQTWTANQGHEYIVSDQDVLALYMLLSDYTPTNPMSDTGLNLIDVLKVWQNTGINGHKIGAYVQVATSNRQLMDTALYVFGGLYCGVELPLTAQNETVWDAVGSFTGDAAPGSWGGHCVPIGSFDSGGYTCCTWGDMQYMTSAFVNCYMDEVWAIVSQDFLDGKQANPLGIDLDALNADLQAVKKQ